MQPDHSDARWIADVPEIVNDLSDEEVDALSRRFDLIPALARSDAAASDLADGMSAVSSLSPETALDLLMVIGDGESFAKLPTPLPAAAEARLEYWKRLYGPTVEHLLNVANLPDDWHRALVSVVRVSHDEFTELLVRLQIHKVRGEQFTLEMTPSSYLQLCTSLLDELSSLPDDVIAELDEREQAAFRAELGRATARVSIRDDR
jgi:hypothetical protein